MRQGTKARVRPGHPAWLLARDVEHLTGYADKRRKVEQLRALGVTFFVNGRGEPVVPRSILDPAIRVEVVHAWPASTLAEVERARCLALDAVADARRRAH